MKTARIVYACLLVLAFGLLFFMPNRVSNIFFFSLLILPIISLLCCLPAYFGLKISQKLEKSVISKDGKAEFNISFSCSTPLSAAYLRPVFKSSGTVGVRESLFIAAPIFGKKSALKYMVTYRHCGSYDAGMTYVDVIDIFGIWRFKKQVGDSKPITVIPPIHSIPYLPLDRSRQSDNSIPRNTKSGESLIVSGVREYEQGDSIKHIHWKLSGKKNELLVKEFEEQVRRAISLEVDTFELEQGNDVTDKLLEAAVGVLDYSFANDFMTSIKIGGGEFINVENSRDFAKAHKLLARFEQSERSDGYFSDDVSDAVGSVLVTSHLSEKQRKSIERRISRGQRVVMIYVYNRKTEEAARLFDSYKKCGILMYSLNSQDEALNMKRKL